MMKQLTRLSILLTALALVVIVLALPTDAAVAYDGKSPDVRFTVINYSQHPFSINGYGPEQFSFTVSPYSKRNVILPRGTYNFTMTACNQTKSGVLDLTKYQIMHVPVCGGNAGAKGEKNHNIDVADYIKMVKIRIRNRTNEPIRLYLRTLDNHYYLNLDPREVTYLIVPRDRYVYSFVACDELQAGYYEARVKVPLDLKCSTK